MERMRSTLEYHHFQKNRTERLIAYGRVVLSTFSTAALWLVPAEPSHYSSPVHSLLTGYLVYSIILTLVVWLLKEPPVYLQFISHTIDLAAFTLLMIFSEGPTSPFFLFFIFSLVCATLRWQRRGTLWTAGIALAAVIPVGIYPVNYLSDPRFDLNHYLIRVIYLAVVALLLASLGAQQEHLVSKLNSMASWPNLIPEDFSDFLRQILAQASGILDAPRQLLVWRTTEDPLVYTALWSGENFQYTLEAENILETLFAPPLAGTNFFCSDAQGPLPEVWHSSPEGLKKWQGAPIDQKIRERFAIHSALGLRLNGACIEGYLLAIDKQEMTADDLVLGRIASQKLIDQLDQFYHLRRLLELRVSRERNRMARDLHDGLLQSLTGAARQLETARQILNRDPQSAQQRLQEIQVMIDSEKRILRLYLQELEQDPSAQTGRIPHTKLSIILEELRERIQRYWGLKVKVHFKENGGEAALSKSLVQGIYFLAHESLINAARHAAASEVLLELAVEDNRVLINVTDNGRGFPFHGHFDHGTLSSLKIGPRTLRERVTAMGGTLELDSNITGTQLAVTMPLSCPGGDHGHNTDMS